MAVPTLTPSRTTSAVVLPSTGTVETTHDGAGNADLYPFGLYTDTSSDQFSQYFVTGASDQVAYVYKKLGGDVLDIELTTGNIYAAYEEATLEYSYIVNIHQAKNMLGSALGNTTGTFDHDGEKLSGPDNVNLKFPKWDFAYERRISSRMGTEANLGGDITIYSASFDSNTVDQDYDLQSIVSASAESGTFGSSNPVGNKKVYVTKVYYKTPHAMWRFYGYYGGLNTVGDLASYGQFADDSTFEVIPAWQNKSQAMAFEDAIYTRNSHFSYELKNNKLRILPRPVTSSPSKYWIEFFIRDDVWNEDSTRQIGTDGVNNMNTLPFENLPYQNINSIGKQWIRRFALSLCKEMLGYVRSKFGNIPIPGESVSLNGSDLISQAQNEQEKLRAELKETLDELTYKTLAETNATVIDATLKVQQSVPLPVVVG